MVTGYFLLEQTLLGSLYSNVSVPLQTAKLIEKTAY